MLVVSVVDVKILMSVFDDESDGLAKETDSNIIRSTIYKIYVLEYI